MSIIDHTFYSPIPKYMINRYEAYIKENSSNPLKYFNSYNDINRIRKLIQSYISSTDDIVFVESESDAINSVLKSIPFNIDDTILYLDISNPLVKDILNLLQPSKQFEKIELSISFPSNKLSIIQQFEEVLQKYSNITYAWVDIVSSQPSFILPIEDIVYLLNSRGIRTIIDGSLSIGQSKVGVASLKPFIFIGTLKNAVYSMNSAFISASSEAQKYLIPSIIHQYSSNFTLMFDQYIENKYPQILTLIWGQEVVDTLGSNKIEEYNHELCINVTKYFQSRWNLIPIVPLNMTKSIISVELPCNKFNCNNIDVKRIEHELRHQKNIWTSLFSHNGKFYSRLTCHIYNDEKEYINFADSIESLLKNVN